MKRLLSLAVAASALVMAVPAMAQASFEDRTAGVEQRIDDGIRDGALSVSDARDLRSRLDSVLRMQQRYEDTGMQPWQARDIDRSLDQLSDRVADMTGGAE